MFRIRSCRFSSGLGLACEVEIVCLLNGEIYQLTASGCDCVAALNRAVKEVFASQELSVRSLPDGKDVFEAYPVQDLGCVRVVHCIVFWPDNSTSRGMAPNWYCALVQAYEQGINASLSPHP